MTEEYDPEAWAREAENEKLREIRSLVDPICRKITRKEVTEEEARQLMDRARLEASYRIPDQLDLYDMIYGSRFERLIEQFLHPGEKDR
jgi:hypothetical protein